MTAHRAWRAKTLSSPGSFIAWSEQEQHSSVGGSDLTNIVGSAIQDSNFSGLPASNAFDDNINTLWACNGTGSNSWLGWDYGATVGNWQDIVEFKLTTRNDAAWTQIADSISFQWSDDWNGTTGTWTEAWRNSGITWTGAGQTKTFAPPPAGLNLSRIEDVPWMDVNAGLNLSRVEDIPWMDAPPGLDLARIEVVAWLDQFGRRRSLIMGS
jgi:hypothetical protein